MSCSSSGLWRSETYEINDIFEIVQIGVALVETICILFYVKINRNISMKSAKNITINAYDETIETKDVGLALEERARKIQKAKENTLLPAHYRLLKWFLVYEILMIVYSLFMFLFSTSSISSNVIFKCIIIVFDGFLVNFCWYTFMYLIIWSLIQRSSGAKALKRSAYISSVFGIIHGATMIFIFYLNDNDLMTTLTIALCGIDLIVLFIFMCYMHRYPRKRYRKSLVCYTLMLILLHIAWLSLNILVVHAQSTDSESFFAQSGSFCIYFIFDALRQVTFPMILFFTLKYDSLYWDECIFNIMSSNSAPLNVWDECVEYTTNIQSNRASLDTSRTSVAFNEITKFAEMQMSLFDWRCLGINEDDDDAMNESYLGMGTSATVFLGTYKEQKVAIKCILCEELDIETMHLFYKEALLSLSLQSRGNCHPNVVQFLGIAIKPPELCLIYEYCKYKSLSNVIYNVALFQDINYIQILYIAKDIAKGMKYLHSQQIVHRDLKTENILIHEYEQKNLSYPGKKFIAKVCDFGLARKCKIGNNEEEDADDNKSVAEANVILSPSASSIRSGKSMRSTVSRSSISSFFSSFSHRRRQKKNEPLLDEEVDRKSVGKHKSQKSMFMTTEVGTVAFLPPEILRNIDFDDSSGGMVKILNENSLVYAFSVDVFSFGCILWELIMRDEVYKEFESANDIKTAVLNGKYPKMPSWAPDDYTNLIKACWENDPLHRPTFQFINSKLRTMIKEINELRSA